MSSLKIKGCCPSISSYTENQQVVHGGLGEIDLKWEQGSFIVHPHGTTMKSLFQTIPSRETLILHYLPNSGELEFVNAYEFSDGWSLVSLADDFR